MKHSWQLSNLELSKRLKELGVKQESLWYWLNTSCRGKNFILHLRKGITFEEHYSAFTVAELGEMLPDMYGSYKIGNFWRCITILNAKVALAPLQMRVSEAHTEANARAKMLIYLLENKLTCPSRKSSARKSKKE